MQVYNTRRQRSQPEMTRTDEQSPLKSPKEPRSGSFLRRRTPFIAALLLVFLGFGALNLWIKSQESARIQADAARQKAADAKHRADMTLALQNRIKLAKEAEQVARANQSFDEKKYFRNLLDKNPGCDVKNPASLTIVLNKKHCLADSKWQPASLTDVAEVKMQKEASGALKTMMADADTAGVGFEVTSGFRSFDDQQALYAEAMEVGESGQPVDLISAKAGYSEHQTGLSADFKILDCVLDCFGTTRRYEWLKANAANFGFIERYPASLGEITGYVHEPWHWRYVGKKTAQAMRDQGIETLEMYLGISGGDYYAS